MFGFIRKMFFVLLTSLVNASSHKNCVFLSNQKCEIQPTHINLHPNEYTQGLRYYPFAVSLDRCVNLDRSFNALNELSNKVCVSNKTEDLSLSVFNMITEINESKTLTSIYHANVNVNLFLENVIQIKSRVVINVGASVKIQENIVCAKKLYLESCYM